MKFLTRADINEILKEYQKELFLLLEKPMRYDEAADFLGYTKNHLRNLVSFRKIPFHKIEGTDNVYFYASELNQHIKKY